MYYALIVITLIVLIIIGVVWFMIAASSKNNTASTADIPNYFVNDCHLQRLLMVETLRSLSTPSSILPIISSTAGTTPTSELITADHMKKEITIFGKGLIPHFNTSAITSITALLHKRQTILHEYYRAMQAMICNKGACVLPSNGEQPPRPIFPDPLSSDSSDLTTLVQRRLAEISQEITDAIAATFNIHHKSSQTSNTSSTEQFQHQRLYNLLTIYDKSLVNQAKSYAAHDYDISMNSSQSALSIAQHINTEFLFLTRNII